VDIGRLAADMDVVEINAPSAQAFRRSHSLLGIVGLAAFQVAPILLLAIVAVTIVLVTGCIDADEAFAFVDGRLLVLIFAMLSVGAALEHTGAVALISNTIAPYLGLLPRF